MPPKPEWRTTRRQRQGVRGNGNTLIGRDNNVREYNSVVQNLTIGLEKALSTEVRLDHDALERIVTAKVDAAVEEYEGFLSQAEAEADDSAAEIRRLTQHCSVLAERASTAEGRVGSISGFVTSQARLVAIALGTAGLVGLIIGFQLDSESSAGSDRSSPQQPISEQLDRLDSEEAARTYLSRANQNAVREMWLSTTDAFRANPSTEGLKGFEDWWDKSVLSVEFIVSPGDPPVPDTNDPTARWTQVALRFTNVQRSGASRQESDYSIYWWKFVRGADRKYHLDGIRKARAGSCPVNHVTSCSISNPALT